MGTMSKKKTKKQLAQATLAAVSKEMARPKRVVGLPCGACGDEALRGEHMTGGSMHPG